MDTFGGFARVMPDVVYLADGTVLWLNGAGKGHAGYGEYFLIKGLSNSDS